MSHLGNITDSCEHTMKGSYPAAHNKHFACITWEKHFSWWQPDQKQTNKKWNKKNPTNQPNKKTPQPWTAGEKNVKFLGHMGLYEATELSMSPGCTGWESIRGISRLIRTFFGLRQVLLPKMGKARGRAIYMVVQTSDKVCARTHPSETIHCAT